MMSLEMSYDCDNENNGDWLLFSYVDFQFWMHKGALLCLWDGDYRKGWSDKLLKVALSWGKSLSGCYVTYVVKCTYMIFDDKFSMTYCVWYIIGGECMLAYVLCSPLYWMRTRFDVLSIIECYLWWWTIPKLYANVYLSDYNIWHTNMSCY